MRTTVAIILMIVGAAVALFGLGSALSELIGLYSDTLSDPLEQPEGGISRRMLTDAAIGAAGIVPLFIGSVMLKLSLLQRLRRLRDSRTNESQH